MVSTGAKGWGLGQRPGGGNEKQDRSELGECLFGGWDCTYFAEGQAEGWFGVCFERTAWGRARDLDVCLRPQPATADPRMPPGKQVDLVSASVVVVGVIAALLFCLLVVVVVLCPVPSAQGPTDDPEMVVLAPPGRVRSARAERETSRRWARTEEREEAGWPTSEGLWTRGRQSLLGGEKGLGPGPQLGERALTAQ